MNSTPSSAPFSCTVDLRGVSFQLAILVAFNLLYQCRDRKLEAYATWPFPPGQISASRYLGFLQFTITNNPRQRYSWSDMMAAIRLAIHGAAGRMGKRLVALGSQDPDLRVMAAIEHAGCPALGQDAGVSAGVSALEVPLSAAWPEGIQAAIDFSSPDGCMAAVAHCMAAGIPLVVATTGLTSEQIEQVKVAGKRIPVCWAPNMSLAVNLTMRLVQQAAKALKNVPQGVDVEIIERHHRYKEDSPSGTALKFGDLVAQEMGLTEHVHGREGQCGARTRNEIGYHAVRAGDDPGQHTIIFGMLGETIELRVAASNRDCYAQGALAAAKFLVGKPVGLYSMFDVLGLV